MAWGFLSRKKSVEDDKPIQVVMAEELYTTFVLDKCEHDEPRTFGIPAELTESFEERWRLYREGMVLKILYDNSQKDAAYDAVLHAYEAIIMPGAPSPQGMQRVLRFRDVMEDLQELL